MVYNVKEIYLTLQGEGYHTGRPAIFCRFTGCNLWSGLEKDRQKATCTFCDTDFIGTDGVNGGKFKTPEELAKKITSLWMQDISITKGYVVFTGGEPTLQLDTHLLQNIKSFGFETAIETNGTKSVPQGLDWICVSPKCNELVQTTGNELKFIYPHESLLPDDFIGLNFEYFCLQPMTVSDSKENFNNIQRTIKYCLKNPQWRLSLQTHKMIGLN